MDADGDFVVAWQSKDQDGDNWGIYAQRFNASGAPQGGEFRVNTNTGREQEAPVVAMDDSGNFVVAWQSMDQDGDKWGIYAQRFNASGAPQGGEFRVNTATSKEQQAPSVAMDADGDFVVAWQSMDQDGDKWGVYARSYDAGGTAQGPEFLVNTYTSEHQELPAIAMNTQGPGHFVVAWTGEGIGDGDGVFARLYAASTSTISGAIFHDVDGDADIAEVGTLAFAGATVSLYRDDGDGVIGTGDVFVSSTTATAGGAYDFTGLADGTYYVVIDSKSLGAANVWAEQTYGVAGAAQGAAFTLLGGALYGGRERTGAGTSDNAITLTGAEHVTRVSVAGGNVANVDSGFSFTAIVNARGDAIDDDIASARLQQGTFRQFILNSNAIVGVQTANFSIGGGGPQSISITAALPAITDAVILDATSQEGFSGTPIIELNGLGSGGGVDALTINSGGSTVRGFVINRFGRDGIVLTGGGGNTIAGNYIGTNAGGTADAGNARYGIRVASGNNLVGGTAGADRNVISGNNVDGIYVVGSSGNFIRGNYIGTDRTGMIAVGNSEDGIWLDNASNTTVGGSVSGAGNVISGNGWSGVAFLSGGSGNIVQGNLIGVSAAGTGPLSNGHHGIDIAGSSGTTVGGLAAGQANVIAHNTWDGVSITSGTGHTISGNSIHSNGGLGIDIGNDAVTPNDLLPGDLDGGANNQQNFPVLTSATVNGGQISITGTLSSSLTGSFRIEFFASSATDPTGHGEGQRYLGSSTVSTLLGSATINATLLSAVTPGEFVSATATNLATGDTSEFAFSISATGNTAPVVSLPVSPTVPEDAPLAFTGANQITVADGENNLAQVTLTVLNGTLTAAAAGGAVVSGSGTSLVTINGIQSAIAATLASVSYQGALNYSGPEQMTVTATDAGGLQDTESVAVTVTPVNDAPAGTDATVTTNEDVAHVFTVANFGFTDVDALDTMSAVRIDTIPAGGTLTLNAVALTAGQVILVADINAGLLRFNPAPDASGVPYTTFTFSVRDSGGPAFDPAPNSLTINVTAVNDAPVANNASASGNEDDAADRHHPHRRRRRRARSRASALTGLPANGVLYIDPGLTTLAAVATDYAAAGNARTFYFVPAGNWNGTTTFQFTANDAGGLSDSTPANATINVLPVNDAPVANNASTSGNEDDAQIAITLTGADTEGPIASFRLIGLPVNGVLYIDPGLTSLAAVATDYAASRQRAHVLLRAGRQLERHHRLPVHRGRWRRAHRRHPGQRGDHRDPGQRRPRRGRRCRRDQREYPGHHR